MILSPLHPNHQEQHVPMEETALFPTPRHYGNPENEVHVLHEAAGLADRCHWSKITVTGSDRNTFLHGLVSNDVKGLASGEGNYTLFLSPQGKILAETGLFMGEEEILLISHDTQRETILALLDKYLILEDVQVHDRSRDWGLITLQGPGANEILSKTPLAVHLPHSDFSIRLTVWDENPIQIMRSSFGGPLHYDFLTDSAKIPTLWSLFLAAGAIPAGEEAMQTLRIESGIPRMGVDLDEKVIPQEAGLHQALSFTKGCYVGQEVVARLHYRGHVNRELTRFILLTDSSPMGALSIQSEGKEIGTVTSYCPSSRRQEKIGIGFLRCEFRKEGQLLTAWDNQENSIELKVCFSE